MLVAAKGEGGLASLPFLEDLNLDMALISVGGGGSGGDGERELFTEHTYLSCTCTGGGGAGNVGGEAMMSCFGFILTLE